MNQTELIMCTICTLTLVGAHTVLRLAIVGVVHLLKRK